ncbi:hypothetical protein J1N35_010310 [Gossypium stocksii]|uniref:Uncharacterized protein n=1 Tax=Gossypium stocksii TaxID=47602 RepID=A0A9D4AAE7_9ROSI|nr:hypothetical protein J1N35_010310 [Gossypium stocksii]
MKSIGVKAQVAIVEQASIEAAQNIQVLVAIVSGASRGIGKAVALALDFSVTFFVTRFCISSDHFTSSLLLLPAPPATVGSTEVAI